MGNAYIEQTPDRPVQTFQEVLVNEPFWMLVGCSLVNLTNWKQAKPVFETLRTKYRGAGSLSHANTEELEVLLKPLGLFRRRASSLKKMARAYCKTPPRTSEDVLKLPGCGKYAADSWAIFIEGRTDVEPKDGVLIHFLKKERDYA